MAFHSKDNIEYWLNLLITSSHQSRTEPITPLDLSTVNHDPLGSIDMCHGCCQKFRSFGSLENDSGLH